MLYRLVSKAIARGDIHRANICRGARTITHLLFADDCLPFFRASMREMENMKRILDVYEQALGQQINFQKSKIFFSRNVA